MSASQFSGGTTFTNVDCAVTDDGSFSFPAATKAELGSSFSGNGSISRFVSTFQQQGNATLVVIRDSSDF